MKCFYKVLSVILAVLMLVTMATACKKEEDEWGDAVTSNDSFNDNSQSSSEEDDDTNDPVNENKNQGNSDKNNADSGNKEQNDTDSGKDTKPSDTADGKGDDKDKQDEIVQNYDGTKKYDMENNPLLAESKAINHGILPSFDLDTTGFVKNDVKLADLEGKTLTFFTAEGQSNFFYTDEKGKMVGEWDWWKLLKSELGLNIRYFESHGNKAHSTIMTYMNSGKALDLIPTHVTGMPLYLKLCQSLNPYINMSNAGNSPGIDDMTMEETKYGGDYHCIAPIGTVNLLVYNQSLVEELNLQDPHTLWQQDKWDWNAWRSFLTSVPTTIDGKPLYAFSPALNSFWYGFPMTNGVTIVDLDPESKDLKLINNWMDDRAIDAVTFYADTVKNVKDTSSPADGNTLKWEETYAKLFDGTLMMSDRVLAMTELADTDYAKSRQYNWVPYPKAPGESGRYSAFSYGFTMEIPKIVKNKNNIPYAVKFAELWANRFTEAMFDYLEEQPHINFSYAQKKEYFEFCIKNTYFGVQMNEWRNLSGESFKAMRDSATGYIWGPCYQEINMATKHREVANIVQEAIDLCMNFQ